MGLQGTDFPKNTQHVIQYVRLILVINILILILLIMSAVVLHCLSFSQGCFVVSSERIEHTLVLQFCSLTMRSLTGQSSRRAVIIHAAKILQKDMGFFPLFNPDLRGDFPVRLEVFCVVP